MKKINSVLLLGTAMLGIVPSSAVHAQLSNLVVSGEIKAQAISTDKTDLGNPTDDSVNSQSLQSRVRLTGNLAPEWNFLTEGRGVVNFGDGGGEDPVTGELLGAQDFVELREAWVQKNNLFSQLPLAARVGRQRFAEPYGFWWNRNFDAARVIYDTTLFKGFLATGQNLASYSTSGYDFNNDDEDIFRVLGEGSWQWRYLQFIETRFVYQDDHSGAQAVGSIVPSNDRDDDDAELLWGGVRFAGALPGPFVRSTLNNYRLDLVGLAGQEDSQTTTNLLNGFRVVSGAPTSQDVRAWAFDGSVDVAVPLSFKPVLTFGYAFGSGDDDATDGTNHTFRQTGLDSNFSYIGAATSGLHNYGTVLRPDLSNLHILTAAAGAPILKASDLTFIYHYYRLADQDGDLPVRGVRGPLSGTSSDVGHGLDIIFDFNIGREFNLNIPYAKKVDFRTTLGAFKAGDAFVTNSDDIALRGLAELRYRF